MRSPGVGCDWEATLPLASRVVGAPNECVTDLERYNMIKCCADLKYFGLEGLLVLGRGQCQEQREAMSR